MKKIISIFILTIGLVTQQAQAIDEAEIDKLEKSVDKLYLTVDKLTNIIVSNEQRGTLEILNDYKSPKAKIIQQWIFIVAQKKKHRSMATFINDSHYKMNSYLGQMQFDSEEAIKSEDYAAIKKEISRIIKNRPSHHSRIPLNAIM